MTTTLVLRHLVRTLAARGKAVLYSSHILEVVERVCSRVIVLHDGVVVADDSVDRLQVLMSRSNLEGVFSKLVMRIDPELVARDLHANRVVAAGRHGAQDVVGHANRGDVEAVLVQVGRLAQAVEHLELDRVGRGDAL